MTKEWTQNRSHLSNVPKLYANLVKQAARATGFDVYIGEPSTPDYDDMPRIGVYTRELTRHHSPFWAEYRRLKAEMEHTDE